VLSGYPSSLYSELYGGWRTVDFNIANHASGGKLKGAAGVSTRYRNSQEKSSTGLVGDIENPCVFEGSVETPAAP
jgi:hypothetical protein